METPRIVGSIRPQRRGPAIADWIPGIGRDSLSGARREPIDLRDCPLPRDDEPGIRRRRIAGTDGVLFVTSPYNWGYPAPPRNAPDHLYRDRFGKPAMVRRSEDPTMPAPTMPRRRIEVNDGRIDPASQSELCLSLIGRPFDDPSMALAEM